MHLESDVNSTMEHLIMMVAHQGTLEAVEGLRRERQR